MAQGREFQRAIDRLVLDLTRFAERAIAREIERAITEATSKIDRRPRRQAVAKPTGPSRSELAAIKRAQKEVERREREESRERRRQEREQLKQELLQAREAARSQREVDRDQQRQERAAARLAKEREAEAEAAARLAPPPLVVFTRSRDGQVTVLQPKQPATEGEPTTPQQPSA